jgi:hypothetical protein
VYSLPNIIRAMKSIRMRWAVHEARIGDIRSLYKVLAGKQEGRGRLEDLGTDTRVIFRSTIICTRH